MKNYFEKDPPPINFFSQRVWSIMGALAEDLTMTNTGNSTTTATAVSQTKAKAWVAGIGTAVVPTIVQNLIGAQGNMEVLFRTVMCNVLSDLACPTGSEIYAALLSILGAIGSGLAVGYMAWRIPNRPVATDTTEGA